jgi:FmdE, Molybdenum formylmethanofuran dehydrogenase operon
MRSMAVAFLIAVISSATTAYAETPDEWITLGARVHGGFGTFIPVGIRIGLDALQRLNAGPREVTVAYYDSDTAPCACIADGVAIATVASVGHRCDGGYYRPSHQSHCARHGRGIVQIADIDRDTEQADD